MKSASREYPRADRGRCDVLCIGTGAFDVFLTVDGFPAENRKYELSGSREEGGGPAANAAFLLSRWGVPAAAVRAVDTTAAGEEGH